MSPLERVARTLCELDGHPQNITMNGKPMWHDYLPEARAAVLALREASEMMIAIGAERVGRGGSDEARTCMVWQSMIDAAYREVSEPETNGTKAAND